MNLLALRQWTVEFLDTAKSEPVLLLKRNNLERGSVDVFPILGMEVVDSMKGDITIKVAQQKFREDFSTRNVEEWPSLDPVVFKHFGIAPVFLPEDHEYKTWIPKQAQCVSHLDRDRVSLGQECEVVRPSTPAEPGEKVFVTTFHPDATPDDVTAWINTWLQADQVISIVPTGIRISVFYRAKEPIR
jgi:hypothetical protein